MSYCVEIRKEFVGRISRCLIKLRAVGVCWANFIVSD